MHLLLGLREVHRSSPQTLMQEGHYTCTCSNWDMMPWGVSDGHVVLQALYWTSWITPSSLATASRLSPLSPGGSRMLLVHSIHHQGEAQ